MCIILDSARRHCIEHHFDDEDMLHAVRNVLRTEDQDDGFTMFVGPAWGARLLLEVGVVDGDDGPVIVHAMKARPKYEAMVTGHIYRPRKGDR